MLRPCSACWLRSTLHQTIKAAPEFEARISNLQPIRRARNPGNQVLRSETQDHQKYAQSISSPSGERGIRAMAGRMGSDFCLLFPSVGAYVCDAQEAPNDILDLRSMFKNSLDYYANIHNLRFRQMPGWRGRIPSVMWRNFHHQGSTKH